MPFLQIQKEIFFPDPKGAIEILRCLSYGTVARAEMAIFRKFGLPAEKPKPLENVYTPACNTFDLLAAFLKVPKEKTAKALMFSRLFDGQLVLAVVLGDIAISEAKLRRHVGEVRLATSPEIMTMGAVPGYVSPVGLKNAEIIVDDLIPISSNPVAEENEVGYHPLNTNSGRDYLPMLMVDLAMAGPASPCLACNTRLDLLKADLISNNWEIDFKIALMVLAEKYHYGKGLRLPLDLSPFDVYLISIPGKQINTRSEAESIS